MCFFFHFNDILELKEHLYVNFGSRTVSITRVKNYEGPIIILYFPVDELVKHVLMNVAVVRQASGA